MDPSRRLDHGGRRVVLAEPRPLDPGTESPAPGRTRITRPALRIRQHEVAVRAHCEAAVCSTVPGSTTTPKSPFRRRSRSPRRCPGPPPGSAHRPDVGGHRHRAKAVGELQANLTGRRRAGRRAPRRSPCRPQRRVPEESHGNRLLHRPRLLLRSAPAIARKIAARTPRSSAPTPNRARRPPPATRRPPAATPGGRLRGGVDAHAIASPNRHQREAPHRVTLPSPKSNVRRTPTQIRRNRALEPRSLRSAARGRARRTTAWRSRVGLPARPARRCPRSPRSAGSRTGRAIERQPVGRPPADVHLPHVGDARDLAADHLDPVAGRPDRHRPERELSCARAISSVISPPRSTRTRLR